MTAKSSGLEAFPPLEPVPESAFNAARPQRPARARRVSSLRGDPRGDTGAGSLATSNLAHVSNSELSPPTSPVLQSVGGKSSSSRAHTGKRKKVKSLFGRWKRMSLKHTWVNPLIVVLVVLTAYFISPGEQNPLHAAIFLSYKNPPLNDRTSTLPAHVGNPTQYGKGLKDLAFFGFYTIVLSFTREFLMQCVIRPVAIYAGIRNRGKQARFMEQAYTAIYFGIFGPYGLFVMSRTPMWFFNTDAMYIGFPHKAHDAYFKAYYLLQAAYWAQQGLVMILMLEKPRKDFKELVLHHIITLALIALSYRFHFTYVGLLIYITMDVSDFFLATSKCFNYLDWWIVGPYFIFFLFVWGYLRHYINLRVLWSMRPGGEFETIGPYELNWETQQYKCLLSQCITFGLLAALQAVNLFWYVLIIRIALRFLFKGDAKDTRSDDEEEEEEAELLEESELDAPPAAAAVAATNPTLLVNGESMDTVESTATGLSKKGSDATRRR